MALLASAIAIAPLSTKAQDSNAQDLSKVAAVAEKPFGSVEDVWSFCRSSIERQMACDIVTFVISQTTNLSLICFLRANNEISEDVKDKYLQMFKQYDVDEHLEIDIAPGVLSTVKQANPACFE